MHGASSISRLGGKPLAITRPVTAVTTDQYGRAVAPSYNNRLRAVTQPSAVL